MSWLIWNASLTTVFHSTRTDLEETTTHFRECEMDYPTWLWVIFFFLCLRIHLLVYWWTLLRRIPSLNMPTTSHLPRCSQRPALPFSIMPPKWLIDYQHGTMKVRNGFFSFIDSIRSCIYLANSSRQQQIEKRPVSRFKWLLEACYPNHIFQLTSRRMLQFWVC